MYTKRYGISIVFLALCLNSALVASETGIFMTDFYQYSGQWTRYSNIGDALSGENPLTQDEFHNKDLSVYVVNNDDDSQAIIMNSWWYTSMPNTNGLPMDDPNGDNYYGGRHYKYFSPGVMEIYDSFGGSIDEINIEFDAPVDTDYGRWWSECNLRVKGSGMDSKFALDFCAENCHEGEFLSYDLQITAKGLYGTRETFGDLIVSSDHPSSGSGSFKGIFQLKDIDTGAFIPATQSSDIGGFYVIEWHIIDSPNSAWIAGDWRLNGDFLDSYFLEDVGLDLTVTSSAGGDVISPGEGVFAYENEEVVVLYAEASDANHTFSFWKKDGQYFSDMNPIGLSVTERHHIRAFFQVDHNNISVSPEDVPIQDIIDTASEGAVIKFAAGTYDAIKLSDVNGIQLVGADPNQHLDDYPVIKGSDGNPVFRLNNVDANTIISGFKITGGNGFHVGGIKCTDSVPTFKNCLVIGNNSSGDPLGAGAVLCIDSNAVFENCTFADNIGGEYGAGVNCERSDPVIHNSIIWNNVPENIWVDIHSDPNIDYSDIGGGWPIVNSNAFRSGLSDSVGIVDADPLFILSGTWLEGVWDDENINYHLGEGSPCIDAGDPITPVSFEPIPNGDIVNLGTFGGTRKASVSP